MYSLAVQTRDKLNRRFFYYRIRSKAEIDLILEGRFGTIPVTKMKRCYNAHIPNIFGESIMAQLHFYVPDKFAQEIRKRAEQAHLPVSRYLVDIISREIGTEWPENYFEGICGGWHGDALKREPEGALEIRLDL